MSGVNKHWFTEGPILEDVDKNEAITKSQRRIRYFLVKYESLVKNPKEIALDILEWSKEVVGLGGEKDQDILMERAEVCVQEKKS